MERRKIARAGPSGRIRSFNLHDAFDLDRDAGGQRRHADGGAGVAAALAEDFDEKVGAAVDHLRRILEFRHRVHHAEHFHHALHAVEAAELALHHREEIETDGARVLVALLDRVFATDFALGPLAVRAKARPLAGEEEEVAGLHGIDVVRDGRGHAAQIEAKLLQPLLGAHSRLMLGSIALGITLLDVVELTPEGLTCRVYAWFGLPPSSGRPFSRSALVCAPAGCSKLMRGAPELPSSRRRLSAGRGLSSSFGAPVWAQTDPATASSTASEKALIGVPALPCRDSSGCRGRANA